LSLLSKKPKRYLFGVYKEANTKYN
jgi:hypothetical protein